MKSKKLILMIMLAVTLTMPHFVNAQPQPDNNDTDTPIDGGISLLVAAGAAIGLKKVKDKKNRNICLEK